MNLMNSVVPMCSSGRRRTWTNRNLQSASRLVLAKVSDALSKCSAAQTTSSYCNFWPRSRRSLPIDQRTCGLHHRQPVLSIVSQASIALCRSIRLIYRWGASRSDSTASRHRVQYHQPRLCPTRKLAPVARLI